MHRKDVGVAVGNGNLAAHLTRERGAAVLAVAGAARELTQQAVEKEAVHIVQ